MAVEPATLSVDRSESPLEHVAVSDGFTLRANALQSDMLPPEMLAQYGMEAGADRGVLNLVVLQKGPDGREATVEAEVTAQQKNLIGQSREIEMKGITANNGTSYLGTFESSPQEFFRFTVTAQPVGTDTMLLLEFEERFTELP